MPEVPVSMPPEVIDKIKIAAEALGESVSAWLTNAAVEQLDEQARLKIGRLAAEELVAEYEAEHGTIPPEVTADVQAFLEEVDALRTGGL